VLYILDRGPEPLLVPPRLSPGAVTREPEIVYLATDQFEELGFAGVFDASVMSAGVFEAIALRPSLNQWHLVAPEFALVRACLKKPPRRFWELLSPNLLRNFVQCSRLCRSPDLWNHGTFKSGSR
jgi:hypothetical protein